MARTPCSGPGSQKSGAERQEQEIRGHMGRSRAGAQEDGWRLVSQAGKGLRALYTLFHDFLLFNFIFTLSPHSVRLAGNSVLVLPGASGCPQGRANILVCYSACRALQSPVPLSLTQQPWLEDPITLTYHGYFHQLPDISSGASRKQGSSPCFWWAPEASLSSPQTQTSLLHLGEISLSGPVSTRDTLPHLKP